MALTDVYDDREDKWNLRQLLKRAKEYINDDLNDLEFDKVSFFYRNKPEEYWSKVERNDNVMKKIRKDYNGDPKSPINGKLSGVFFSVTLHGGKLPTASPFGNTRVHIPIEAVFRKSTNLYFTDFYCTTSYNHYVTLVLTRRSSREDLFCQRNLLKLDPEDNLFLRRRRSSLSVPKFKSVGIPFLHVEVFYTENIDLDFLLSKYGPEKVFFKKTGIIGRGHSTWGGLQKRNSCTDCNVRSEPVVQPFTQNMSQCNHSNQAPQPDDLSWWDKILSWRCTIL